MSSTSILLCSRCSLEVTKSLSFNWKKKPNYPIQKPTGNRNVSFSQFLNWFYWFPNIHRINDLKKQTTINRQEILSIIPEWVNPHFRVCFVNVDVHFEFLILFLQFFFSWVFNLYWLLPIENSDFFLNVPFH